MGINAAAEDDRGPRGIGIALLLGGILCSDAVAQTASAGTDDARFTERVAQLFADFVQPDEPGCSVAAMRQDEVVHASAHGLADLAGRTPLTPASVFNIASISKQFTAFSILLLEERGELSIDDPLTRYVPELAASARGVTLRHLIHHTGGLRDYMDLLLLGGRTIHDGATQHETVQLLARQRAANASPGAEYAYSNSGYVLLATVVERVSGLSMKQFAQKNIFKPMDMTETTIVDRYPAALPELARGYARGSDGFRVEESAWEQVGDGQVYTTVIDLFRWAKNLHTGSVGGPGLMARMVEAGELASGEKLDYAAGLSVGERNGRPIVRHGGGWAGYRSHFLHVPGERFTVNVFCNRRDLPVSGFAEAIADLYLDGESQSLLSASDESEEGGAMPTGAWRPGNLTDYEGAYWSEEAQARCVLVRRTGELVLEGCAGGLVLQPGEAGEFRIRDIDAAIRFEEPGGKARPFTFHSQGVRELAFIRQ